MDAAAAHQRLVGGFVRRVAADRDADAFALRGGLLIQTWMPEFARAVRDVDLVCRLPYQLRDLRARLRQIVGRRIADGVTFDERVRVDGLTGSQRGLQLFARGEVDGTPSEIAVDVMCELEIWPPARRTMVGDTQLWACPHEMVIATKVKLLGELGPAGWRTKDLADLWAVLRRFPIGSLRSIGEALERSAGRQLGRLFDAASHQPAAAARWTRFAVTSANVPSELAAVLGEIRGQLAPFVRQR